MDNSNVLEKHKILERQKQLKLNYDAFLHHYAREQSHANFTKIINSPLSSEYKFLILPETIDFNVRGIYGGGETLLLPLNEPHLKGYLNFFSEFAKDYYTNAKEILRISPKKPCLSLDVVVDMVNKSLLHGFREEGVKETYLENQRVVDAIKKLKMPKSKTPDSSMMFEFAVHGAVPERQQDYSQELQEPEGDLTHIYRFENGAVFVEKSKN